MKYIFLFALLLSAQICIAQSAGLVQVPGTKCSLVPPEGFVVASTFRGFQHPTSGASIMINELPAPYQSLVDGFTPVALQTRGMKFLSKEQIDLNKAPASLFYVSQPANGITYLKQMLVFGDAKHTVLINGIYPESSKSLEGSIKDALLSTVYNVTQNDNPLDAASFTIQVDGTEFKVVQYLSGTLIYATDGKIPTDGPSLIASNSIAKVSATNQKQYAMERLKKLPGGDKIEMKQIQPFAANNLSGYEIVAEGKTKDNLPELVYQVMLFNSDSDYYIIIGKSKEDFEKYTAIFRQIAGSFKRK